MTGGRGGAAAGGGGDWDAHTGVRAGDNTCDDVDAIGRDAVHGVDDVGEKVNSTHEVLDDAVPAEATFDGHVLVPAQAHEVNILGRFAEPVALDVALTPSYPLREDQVLGLVVDLPAGSAAASLAASESATRFLGCGGGGVAVTLCTRGSSEISFLRRPVEMSASETSPRKGVLHSGGRFPLWRSANGTSPHNVGLCPGGLFTAPVKPWRAEGQANLGVPDPPRELPLNTQRTKSQGEGQNISCYERVGT